jgi:predicted GNAT superfamily acetyltransferase
MIVIDQEPFSVGLFLELMPLAQKCWEESTQVKGDTCAFYGERDFAIEPDMEQYQRFADAGGLVLMTMRNDGTVRGYAGGFLYRSWHHKKLLCAAVDSIYIEPEYRSYAAVLVEKFETALKRQGVEIIGWPTHPNGPVYALLKARGYVGDDVVMEKRIVCALQ